jgi:putative nucleotidyltransferase with HDIG domain
MAARVSLSAVSAAGRAALRTLIDLAGPSRPVWLVGGAVRQLLAGEPVNDLDLATPREALALGRALADRLGGRFVALDRERGAGRVVGAGPGAIGDDPVRALRGARLAARPEWRLDPDTEAAIRAGASRLDDVAAERIRDELAAILGDPRAATGLRMLDRLGLLAAFLPESASMRATAQPLPHRFDVWEHSLQAVEAVDVLLADLDALAPWGPGLRLHLAGGLGGGFTRREALRLAALLHDVAKPETRAELDGRIRFFGHDAVGARRVPAIAERLRLPRRVSQVVERLVAQHLRPMHLAQAGQITRRARFRFFRALGDDAPDLLLLALADAAGLTGVSPLAVWAGEGGAVVRALMAGAEAEAAATTAPRLLRGEDVMAAFGLSPGPAVGRLLERAREAQALGLVESREEALDYLRGPAGRDDSREGGEPRVGT